MINRRKAPDGLPFRTYERRGVRVYSIGYKGPDGKWTFRLSCSIADVAAVRSTRREALRRIAAIQAPEAGDRTFSALADTWLKRQRALPPSSAERRSDRTLDENVREIATLKKAFGPMLITDIEKADAYAYLDACEIAVDEKGAPRPRAAKGNKEISLAGRILEYGVRLRWLVANPFDGVDKLRTLKEDRLVSDQELALALEIGRRMGGPQLIVALALRTAWLCVRRSVEVRALTRDMIGEKGITWVGAKRQRGEARKVVLIEWSPELHSTVDEALAITRRRLAGGWYVFGNLSGQRYTKGGWKATLAKLMNECVAEAARRRIAFAPFSLQDCRPMGVTEKMARGDEDTVDATAHSSERMVRQVYDRRRIRVAKPTK